MRTSRRGFSLIEMMIVVAIVAVLASIAFPAYRSHQVRSAESACLAEMKTYATWVVAAMVNETVLPVPPQSACATSELATAASTSLTGAPRSPGTRTTTCDMGSAACAINP